MTTHLRAFLGDQAALVSRAFNSLIAVMPLPRGAGFVSSLPYVGRYFRFVRLALESYQQPKVDGIFVFPKFLTLPLEVMRKRNPIFVAKSCVKALAQASVSFDLIHAHFLDTNGLAGAALKAVYDKPLIITAHGHDVYDLPFRNRWYEGIAKYALQKADHVITVSRSNAEKLLSLGVSSRKLDVIPNGYDARLFRPMSLAGARGRLGLPLNKKVLLSVGNLVEVKGHTYLVDAMRTVLKKRNDVLLVIVGTGPLEERLVKRARDYGLGERILFVGRKEHEEIPSWINACDILVLPSLNEGFPTVIPEAMACGKPVVGTEVGGIPEAISNDRLGLLANPRDSESLAQSILLALDRKWNHRGITAFSRRYSLDNLVGKQLCVYRRILDNA